MHKTQNVKLQIAKKNLYGFYTHMQISQTNYNYPKYNTNIPNRMSSRLYSKSDTVSFNGHMGSEKLFKKGVKHVLRHETALFRDMQTKNFVCDYILENFKDKPNIKMVVGACCSGEEAYTYSMLLNSIRQRLSIVGFDLSENIVEQAKSGKVLMQQPQNVPEGLMDLYSKAHADSFLCFDIGKPLSKEQTAQKQLFDEFFEITPEIYTEKESLKLKFTRWYMQKFLKVAMPTYDSKIIKVRDGKFANCSFTTGDILDLDAVTKGKKADIITFSNAMYHLTTNDILNGMYRLPKDNSEEIVRKIAANVKANLNPNGIFVLGENEIMQTMDPYTVPKVFKEMGFEPLNKTEEHMENVWRLVK